MILSDKTLKAMIASGDLVCEPIDEKSIQPASIDCRLGDHFLIPDDHQMDMITLDSEIKYREITNGTITIPPHSFLLATTQEYIELPDNLTSFVEGRSSIGRIGLFIQNAGWVDPGFKGRITLELYNASSLPIKLEAGKRICQLVFAKMDQVADNPYSGKYQGQRQTVGSRVYQDTDRVHVGVSAEETKEQTKTV
jgi:dCTP deaminase